MIKTVSLLFITSLVLAINPKSIHYSGLGDYLVDQDGNKTTIQGNPWLVCHQGLGDLEGTFQKQKGATIWLKNASIVIEVAKPICDIE
jgi:hypothetical protein